MTFAQMLDNFTTFDKIEAASLCMQEKAFQIIGVNQDQLYEEGIGADGKPLPPYSPAYAKIKQKQRGKSIVDIWRTGKLQSDMKMVVQNGTYDISSSVPYSPYVQARRPTIYGLTLEGKAIAWTIIRDTFVERLKEHISK